VRLLVIDTCLAVCQVAVFDDAQALSTISEPMVRGHQERLAPMAGQAMDMAQTSFAALDRIAVTVGPGSFTGLRVGLAFAKGLALALDRPCMGVGTLTALAASAGQDLRRAAIIDAGRGGVYLQIFEGPNTLTAPDNLPIETAAARLLEVGAVELLIGPQAERLAGSLPKMDAIEIPAPSPAAIAALAAAAPVVPPRPLYLRAPDAQIR
jgi:tRNA threonylcarbamoyladenosine biosynthesis protein TsaB